jgi:integrase/recombinase XerD
MKPRYPTDLGQCLMRFFQDYLPMLRGMSVNTIHSYRDTLVLWLQFTARETTRAIEALEIADIDAERVGRFLKSLQSERNNKTVTRNVRLAAIHAFARFLIAEHPEYMAALQRVLAVPFKRGKFEAPIEYLEKSELEALLASIDRTKASGQRDYALFAVMFNTGARVQEILDLRVCDVRLDPPCQVRLCGKGHKMRLCPIWPRTAELLRGLIASRLSEDRDINDRVIFVNRCGEKMTRFGVRYLLRKYVVAAGHEAPTLLDKHIHPHSLRHTTAIYLLKAGVDFATISQWLGHSSLNTTMRYARADIDLKRQALTQVFPDALAPPKAGAYLPIDTNITDWLRRL